MRVLIVRRFPPPRCHARKVNSAQLSLPNNVYGFLSIRRLSDKYACAAIRRSRTQLVEVRCGMLRLHTLEQALYGVELPMRVACAGSLETEFGTEPTRPSRPFRPEYLGFPT